MFLPPTPWQLLIKLVDVPKGEVMQSRSRILVIDDDAMFRSLVVTLLRKDYLVSVAGDGESGYHKACAHRPDLVIIDFQMPGWDGVRTLESFRQNPALCGVKVVMLTSDASKETVLAAIKAGTDEYIIKTSFSKQDFLSKIQKLLNVAAATAQATTEATFEQFSMDQTPALGPVSSQHPHILDVASEQKPVVDTSRLASSSDRFSVKVPEIAGITLAPQSLSDSERLSEILDEWE